MRKKPLPGTARLALSALVFAALIAARVDAQSPGPSPAQTLASTQPSAGLPAGLAVSSAPPPLSLEETLRSLGAGLRWDPFFKSGVLTIDGHYAAFKAGGAGEEAQVLLDSREIIVLPAPFLDNGQLFFPQKFIASLKKAVEIINEEDKEKFRIAAIIVDPGHGGKDAGALGTHTIDGKTVRLQEKDINLTVSRELYQNLAAAYPDKRVLMTRQGDTFPRLEDRVSIANSVPLKENEAILFVSVHTNSSFNQKARGYEVWYLSPEYRRMVIDAKKYNDSDDVMAIRNAMLEEEFTTESIMMAQSILKQMDISIGKLSPSRGLKAEEWFVVRNARMPSVLVEVGFISSPEDAKLLAGGDYLKGLADAIYKGIMDFVTVFERSGGFIQDR